jgi:hypothetical protein
MDGRFELPMPELTYKHSLHNDIAHINKKLDILIGVIRVEINRYLDNDRS